MENTYGSGGEDVFIQILVCLPVKSLLRFKSVCKSWRELIQSSFFINLHTSFNSFPASKFGTLIIQAVEFDGDDYYKSTKAEIQMFTLSSGSGGGGGDEDEDDQVVFKVSDLEFSTFYKDFLMTDTVSMVGSCNGLICLHDSSLGNVSLWNPATKQFRILPKSITIYNNWDSEFVAFGFDVKTKDYKVVWITLFTRRHNPVEEECKCRVQVYSLSTDSWRLLEGINSLPVLPRKGEFLRHGIYLNGRYFFVGIDLRRTWSFLEVDGESINPRCNNSLMLSFDFTKEVFTIMQFPDHDSRHDLILSNYFGGGDKMAVFITRSDHGHRYEYCDVWVLNEHGSSGVNKESWTKLHSFRIKNNLPLPRTRPKPMCILNVNDGEFALISTLTDKKWFRRKLQLFSLVTKEAKKDFTIGNMVLRANVYKQSLVSIIGGNGAAAAAKR